MKRPILAAFCVFLALGGVTVHDSFAAPAASDQQSASGSEAADVGQAKGLDAEVRPPDQTGTGLPEGDADINQLLRLWGVFGEKIDADCASLHIGALHCLSARGTLETLKRFNRPAILVLQHHGHEQRVLITGLSKKDVTISGANGARRISHKRLKKVWTGQYEMIWRTDAGAVLIYPGMRSSAVVWLRKRLALADDDGSDGSQASLSRYFGSVLEARVRNFQLMHGLKPDGLVGPRTQIALNGVKPGAGMPTLTPKAKE